MKLRGVPFSSVWQVLCGLQSAPTEIPWVWSQNVWFFGHRVQGAEIVQERSINGNQDYCLRKYKLDQRLSHIKQVSVCGAVYDCETNLC